MTVVSVSVSVVRCGGGISFSGRFGGSFAQIMSIMMTIRISVSVTVISVSITMTIVSVTISVPRCSFGFRSGFWGSCRFGGSSWFSIGGSLTQIMSITVAISVISVMTITMAIISVVGISFGCYHSGKG